MSIARMIWHHFSVNRFFRASGASVLVPPGIPIKPIIRGEMSVSQPLISALRYAQPAWISLRLEYSEQSGRFEIASFGIDRHDEDYEISGAFLRTVQVHAITKFALADALPSWGHVILQLGQDRASAEARGLPQVKASDESALLLTAMVYRIAEISGENPVKTVAESLGLKLRTATNWIQRARNAGLMTSTEHAREARRIARKIEPYFRPASGFDAVADELLQSLEGD